MRSLDWIWARALPIPWMRPTKGRLIPLSEAPYFVSPNIEQCGRYLLQVGLPSYAAPGPHQLRGLGLLPVDHCACCAYED